MLRYITNRVLQAIPLLFIISVILFVLMMNMGDPIAAMAGRNVTRSSDRARLTRQLGLDQPIYKQYFYWLVGNDWKLIDIDGDGVGDNYGTRKGILRGDFGTSLVSRGRPALDIILERIPNTLLLMIPAEIVTLLAALAIGIYSAMRQYSWFDQVVTTGSFIGYSMPIFFIALASMYIFAVNFRKWGLPYLPTVGMFDPKVGKTFFQVAIHMVLPIFSMAVISVSSWGRYIRSQILEVVSQDYIRTARAKGLPHRQVIFIHALKNASLPIVTIIGLDLPLLLSGAIVTERIFAWPGIGQYAYQSVTTLDFPSITGVALLIAINYVVINLVVDILYSVLDPRIRMD